VYVPLREISSVGPQILEGLASRELVCLDDIDSVVEDADWEAALFGLYNQVFDARHNLVVCAPMPPRECATMLADLQSRFASLPAFQLQALQEPQRVAALQLRARHRGLDLPDDTARFLLSRSRRDMASLYRLLDKLDREALRAKRRLTIPFVKDVLPNF
jgi:DnaA family protein